MRTSTSKITKKQIQAILRTEDKTQIFRLYKEIYGQVGKCSVYDFIRDFAPTNKVRSAAFRIAIGIPEADYPGEIRNAVDFKEQNAKHLAMEAFREELKRGLDNYTKRPMMGHAHLYFCSPVYGHADYNKWCAMPIKGNERFCEVLCKLADKYFPVSK